jgi:hypothetical protein
VLLAHDVLPQMAATGSFMPVVASAQLRWKLQLAHLPHAEHTRSSFPLRLFAQEALPQTATTGFFIAMDVVPQIQGGPCPIHVFDATGQRLDVE